MGRFRYTFILTILVLIVLIITTVSARTLLSKQRQQSTQTDQRIDCYPDTESSYSNYSKQSCLARNCLFDDAAVPGVIQCYLPPNYGYILQDTVEKINNGLRLKLKRNSAVASMFQEPIENVLLEIQYYTNDIIRLKFYDADSERYEVRSKMIYNTKILVFITS